jgi:hypothetical protein
VFRNRCKVAMAASGLCLLAAVLVVGFAGWTPGKARATSAPIENGWLGTGTAGATVGKATATSGREGKLISVVFVQQKASIENGSGGFTEFVVSGPVLKHHKTVGFGVVRCTFAASGQGPNQGLAECDGTFNFGPPFPGGSQITIQGLSSPATHWFNAITGGTGRYAHARGEVDSRNIGTTNKIGLIFHVTT